MNRLLQSRAAWTLLGFGAGALSTWLLCCFLYSERAPEASATHPADATTEFNTELLEETDVHSLLSIHSMDDIRERRRALGELLWPGSGFPHHRLPDEVERDVVPEAPYRIPQAAKTSRFRIQLAHGLVATLFYYEPEESNRHLVVFHDGHRTTADVKPVAEFLGQGHPVLLACMPLMGPNPRPEIELPFGTIRLSSHDDLWWLESESFQPLSLFVEPVAAGLNFLLNEQEVLAVSMVGVSGGGWTTVLYAALDDRIGKSVPVAGSLPLFLRRKHNREGDYEQLHPTLYRRANYLDLYVMGSAGEGRSQLQIFNRYDPCCFDGLRSTYYEEEVAGRVDELGAGEFSVWIDETHAAHRISHEGILQILRFLHDS